MGTKLKKFVLLVRKIVRDVIDIRKHSVEHVILIDILLTQMHVSFAMKERMVVSFYKRFYLMLLTVLNVQAQMQWIV